MIKVIGVVAFIAGILMLGVGILGLFGRVHTAITPWAFIIMGLLFSITSGTLLRSTEQPDVFKDSK